MVKGTGDRQEGPQGPAHPYLDWAVATRFVYLRAGDWLPLLVEFDPGISLQRFTGLEWLDEVGTLKSAVRIPELFQHVPPVLEKARNWNFCVLLVQRRRAAELFGAAGWKQTIRGAELGPPMHLADTPAPAAPPPAPPGASRRLVGALRRRIGTLLASARRLPAARGASRRVVVAVLDEGIAFAHSRFSTPSGTRIKYLWQQDVIGLSGLPSTPGIELTAADIDAAMLAASGSGGGEEGVYRALGSVDFGVDGYKPLARRRSHGTHVLDLAAGYDPNDADDSRPIIAVEMPEEAVGDPAGSTLIPQAVWGLVYIQMRAEALRAPGETLPVVVNISYGPHEGPHDGSSWFETIADTLTVASRQTQTPMQIVLAAGNFRQSRIHASFELQPNSERRLQWRLQPCGLTPSFMEIWLQRSGSAQATLALRSPLGDELTVKPTDPLRDVKDARGELIAQAQYVPADASIPRSRILVSLAPTALDRWIPGGHPVAPSGTWEVSITNTSPMPLHVEAWIKRSDTRSGRRAKGRQSYFDDPSYQRYDKTGRPVPFDNAPGSYVKRTGTLSGIATGRETYVIGAHVRGPDTHDLMPAHYSSEGSGAPVPRTMRAPNWLAPGEDSRACPGVLSAGTRSGARVAMNGTSAAAPQATRLYADEWARGNPPIAYPPGLWPPSSDVPAADRPLVAGNGVKHLQPPLDRLWKDRP
jgi:hypothetical protein